MPTIEQIANARMQRRKEIEELINLRQMGYISEERFRQYIEEFREQESEAQFQQEYLCRPYDRAGFVDESVYRDRRRHDYSFYDPVWGHYEMAVDEASGEDKTVVQINSLDTVTLTNVRTPITDINIALTQEENILYDYLYFAEETRFERDKEENLNAILLLGD
jgi:hypothetical protein